MSAQAQAALGLAASPAVLRGVRTVTFTHAADQDCAPALAAAIASAIAAGVRVVRLSGELLFSSATTITVQSAANFTILLTADCKLTKTSPSYYPLIEFVSGVNCHIIGEPGNLIDNTVTESLTFAASAGGGPFATTWKVRNTWDVQFFTTRTGGVLDYQHAGSSNYSVSVNGTTSLATITKAQVLADAQTYTIYTPVARQPVVLLTDCQNSSIKGLHITQGAVVSQGKTTRPRNISILENQIDNGQVRITTVGLEFYRWLSTSFVPAFTDDRSHYGVRVRGNTIRGDLDDTFFGNGLSVASATPGGTGTGRYLKFNERVDGMVVDGWAEDVEIDNNSIKYAHGDGIRLHSCRKPKLRGNTISDSGLSGIGPENTTAAPKTKNALIVGNTVRRSIFDGIDFNFGGTVVDSLRTGSPASRGRTFAEFAEQADWTIVANDISWNGLTDLSLTPDSTGQEGGNGIFMWSIAGSSISGNTLSYNNTSGIRCDGGLALMLTENRCFNNGRSNSAADQNHAGITLKGVRMSTVARNVFYSDDDPDFFGSQKFGITEESLPRTDSTGYARPHTIVSLQNITAPNVFKGPLLYMLPSPGQRDYVLPWKLTSTASLSIFYECNAGLAWAQSAAYALNDVVFNGGRVYVCTTAGVSAATGAGPVSASGTEADGTVVWTFVNSATNAGATLVNGVDYNVSGLGTGAVTVSLTADPVLGYALRFALNTQANVKVVSTFGSRQFTKTYNDPGGAGGAQVTPAYQPWYAGTTTQRNQIPVDAFSYGLMCFDRTLGKPVWYTGTGWVDATGATV